MTVTILVGDCRRIMAEMPAESIQSAVTSPPYFGLRDYGTAQWNGGDSDCDHIKTTSLRRDSPGGFHNSTSRGTQPATKAVEMQYRSECGKCGAIRSDMQIGREETLDEYIATMVEVFRGVWRVLRNDGTLFLNVGDSYAANRTYQVADSKHRDVGNADGMRVPDGMKSKDLMMVPATLAIALRNDGWYLRSDIIWHKPNPMPESVTDRPTSAHEHIFLLTKNPTYYYDAEAVRIPLKGSSIARLSQNVDAQVGSVRANGGAKTNGTMKAVARTDKQRGHARRHDGFNDRWDSMSKDEQQANGANLRNVWTIATQAFPLAHFATFPEALVEPCIKAGSKTGDTILDPFAGSGTTGLVADRMDRDAVLIELNPEYAQMAHDRIVGAAPMFARVNILSEGLVTA